jgi:hypothetical protein
MHGLGRQVLNRWRFFLRINGVNDPVCNDPTGSASYNRTE